MIAGLIAALAANLDRRWRRIEYDDRGFAMLARDCLAEAALHAELDGAAVLAYAITPRAELRASHLAPGVLPIFCGQRFDIHAHFWPNDVALPHDHAWAGAFQIVEGRSLNSYHQFVESERVRASMRLGRLQRSRVQLQVKGDCIAVQPGRDFIHGLHYLDRCGVAISVRAKQRRHESMTYFRPGLALGQAASDEVSEQTLRALAIAWQLDEVRYLELLDRLVRSGDRVTTYLALVQASQDGWNLDPSIHATARALQGPSFATFMLALDDLSAYREVVDLRKCHPDPELRAFLAALHSSDDRGQFVEALAACALPEPLDDLWDRVGAWLVTLLVDAEDTEIPAGLAPAFGRIVRSPISSEFSATAHPLDTHQLDAHQLEFLVGARAALVERPLYRALFREPTRSDESESG